MSLMLDKIIITKTGNKGEASVFMEDEDGVKIRFNGFIIDFSNGVDPVSILTYNNSPIISGNIIDEFKDSIYDIFSALNEEEDAKIGLFEFDGENITQL